MVHYIKYKLYDAGFIVVREEYRLLNLELAQSLCRRLDEEVLYDMDGPAAVDHTATTAAAAFPSEAETEVEKGEVLEVETKQIESTAAVPPPQPLNSFLTPEKMVGTAFVFALAHRNCHAELQSFVARQLCEGDSGEETVADFLAVLQPRQSASPAPASQPDAPFFVNQTAAGAKKAISLLFPRMLAEDIPTSAVSREYVQEYLKQALTPALTGLAKEKPADPLRWLAVRLLSTNVAAPPMMPGP